MKLSFKIIEKSKVVLAVLPGTLIAATEALFLKSSGKNR
jgi:hypothetical protein